MKMKRMLAALLAASAVAAAGCMTAAAEDTANVSVTIANEEGKLVLVQQNVTVTDADADGVLTISDALYFAHEACFEGGAEAGFAAAQSEYGLSLNKLWGVANGGSYGYYVNNTAAMSLADPVADGDFVNAFIYTDTMTWSDKYSWFDVQTVSAEAGAAVSLTLQSAGYDESWNPVTLPVAGAVITINGEKTDFVTDENGKAEITFTEGGSFVVSAVSDSVTLVPPVCKAEIAGAPAETEAETDAATEVETEAETTAQTAAQTTAAATTAVATGTASPQTGDNVTAIGVAALAGAAALVLTRRRNG